MIHVTVITGFLQSCCLDWMRDFQLLEQRVCLFRFSKEIYQIRKDINQLDYVRCVHQWHCFFCFIYDIAFFYFQILSNRRQLEVLIIFLYFHPNRFLILSAEVKGVETGIRCPLNIAYIDHTFNNMQFLGR